MDPEQYFEEVITGVSHRWDDLARKLGFNENKIKGIRMDQRYQDHRCREVLDRWRNKEGRKATLQVLKQALIDIDERSTAESLEDDTVSYHSYAEVSDVGPSFRSVDVQDFFHHVINGVSYKWDDLAWKLGFSRNKIKDIATTEPSPDHRCREVLDRWRNREGRRATVQVLKQALIDIGERWAAESLEELSSTSRIELRGPKMARLYADACRQGSLPVYSTRVPVVGQYRSGKSCFIKRLMEETVREEEVEPITDGINIISDVQTKTYKKSQEEIEELAGPLLRKQLMAEASAGDIAASKQAITADVNEYFDNVVTKVSHKWDDLARQLGSKTRNEIREIRASEPDDEHRCRKVLERWRNKMGEKATLQILNQALVAIDEYQAVETFEAQEKRPLPPSENLEKQMQPGGSKTPTKITEEVTDVQGEEEYTKKATESPETSTIPDIVVEAAEKMRKAGITEEDVGTPEHPRLSFWDFGGQATYYGTHHCFITHRGVYILVMSLLQKLSDPVPDLDYKASVDNLRTGGDYLDHWLNTVRSHTLQHQTGQPRRPPVIIVLTHKDKVSQEYIEKYKEEIRNHINDKAAGRLVMPKIFAVDNTTEDAAVDEIRDYIRLVAGGLPHMGEEIPIPWLHLKSRLRKKREEGPFVKFQDVAELARDPDINITDEHTLALVLTFLHDRGDVIFFDEPSLRNDVTLQPQVLIDVFKTIITVPQYQQDRVTDTQVRKMWERLEKEGVLSDELLTRIWEEKDQQLKKPFLLQHKSFLKALMEKFYLICNATPVGDASDEAQQEEIYFVPALLSCERDNSRLYPSNMYICPEALYFVFSEQFLPSGMFSRLQALCVSRFGLQESCVFAGCARFPTDDKEQAFVITKVNHYLKVELLSSSNIFTEGLRVRKFLSSALFEIKEKWIPCIQYELCCSTQQEDRGEPAFRALPTEHWSLEQLWGIPSVFRAVWMPDGYQRDRTANSGGDGPVILQPLGDPDTIVGMRTIGPVLDTLEQGGGLTLDQVDHIRNQLTPIQRVLDMRRKGEVDPYQLGAAVEMCLPEFVDLFLREKRGKELVILHSGDYTAEFVLPLQTAARKSELPCHTEVITATDTVTEKTVELLLNTNDRMVALVIGPQALHHKHWSNLDYEFQVLNQKLLLPILLYPNGSRDRMVRVLQQRSAVLFNMKHEEIQMEGGAVPEGRLLGIVHNVLFGSIFSRLDEAGFKSLLRVWSARTGKQESQEIKRPQDLMRAMATTGYITADDFETLEKDMIAAGISFPVIVRDNPGVSQELQYRRKAEAPVGPEGGEVEIPGFVKLVVPQGVLQQETTITVSIVDISRILSGPGGVSWTSGYPWSLGEDACSRELLDQVLFSTAVKVNLHGAQLSGPLELETWRPPGSEGMECILLKHHDGEGWTDITASTWHHSDSDKLSVRLSKFSEVASVWTIAVDKVKAVTDMLARLWLGTLTCRFAAYIQPHEEDVDFHVVWWDKSVKPNEELYQPCFTKCCISQEAMFDLYHGDNLEIAVSVTEGEKVSKQIVLNNRLCRSEDRQHTQMCLKRPEGKPMKGKVVINNIQEKPSRLVCDFTFREKISAKESPDRERVREPSVDPDVDSGLSEAESDDDEDVEATMGPGDGVGAKGSSRKRRASPPPAAGHQKMSKQQRKKGLKRRQASHAAGSSKTKKNSEARDSHLSAADDTKSSESGSEDSDTESKEPFMVSGSGSKPVVVMLNDEYGTAKGGISTIHRQMGRFLVSKGAKVYCTVLDATPEDRADAEADEVELIFPTKRKGDPTKPGLNWLTWEHRSRYPELPDADFIVGHVNITSRAAKEIKEDRLPAVKLVQVTHVIPENVAHYKGEGRELRIEEEKNSILEDLKDADVIVSVGPRLFDYYRNETKDKIRHEVFLPEPSDIFKNAEVAYVNTETKVVLSIGRVVGVERLKGYDLTAKTMVKVLKQLPNTIWRVCGISREDFAESKAIIEANMKKDKVPFTPLEYCTQEKLCETMRKADVVLMPSRAEPFGLVGLEAIAAGVPALVSHKSGLAWFLGQEPDFDRPIVKIEDDDDKAAQTLAGRILDVLKNGEKEFKAAKRLKERLLASRYWDESHDKFAEIFGLN